MAVPDFQSIFLPMLKYLADGVEHSKQDAVEYLSNHFSLSKEDIEQRLPSGRQLTFSNRVGWSRTYLKKAGLIKSTRRGFFKITKRGLEVLNEKPRDLRVKDLKKYPEFQEFHAAKPKSPQVLEEEITPEEQIEQLTVTMRTDLAKELLEQVKSCSPAFFERLVVDLLVAMGYGGSIEDAGQAVGGTGDEGIDGVIKEDSLGLDSVYIQAKRWNNTVSRPEIQKFVGALNMKKSKKGVFITTSDFSSSAVESVKALDIRIVLIDGPLLAQLMIENNVGVSLEKKYELKRIDLDYFVEE